MSLKNNSVELQRNAWVNRVTPLNAENLNTLQNQVVTNEEDILELNANIVKNTNSINDIPKNYATKDELNSVNDKFVDYAKTESIPTNLSDFNNDAGYEKTSDVNKKLDKKADKTQVKTDLDGKVDKTTFESFKIDNSEAIEDAKSDAISEIEGKGYSTKEEAKGYADAKDASIAAAQKSADDITAYVGTFTHNTAKTVVEYVDEKTKGIPTSGNIEELNDRVTALENSFETNDFDILLLDGMTVPDEVKDGTNTDWDGSYSDDWTWSN